MTMTTAFATTTVPATGDADITTRPIFDARWLITTLTALLDRRGHLQVAA
jgi:hypothetical protein